MKRRRPAVFLDRDGVLNRTELRDGKPYAPRRVAEFRLLPGAAGAVRRLKQADFWVGVVTNQPDIGNGLVEQSVVAAMHERLRARVPVDAIAVCPHRPSEGCDCRKPKPGMLTAFAADFGLDLAGSFMVGDRIPDMLAGRAAGCYTIFIDRGYRESQGIEIPADTVTRSLPESVRYILEKRNHRHASPR